MLKITSIAAMIAGLATASFAGTPAPATEDDDVGTVFVAPSSSGMSVPLAVGGAVLALALIASGSNNGAVNTTTTP